MSFRLKTILGVAAIEAVLLAILVVSGLGWLKESNEEQLVQRAATTARLFATMTKDGVLTTDLAALESFVQEALTNPGLVYARVRNAEGQVLAEGGSWEALARVFAPDGSADAVTDGVFDTFAEILEAGRRFGRVEVGLSATSLRSLLREAGAKGIGISLLEMVLVALFSLLLGTYLTRQLRYLRDASRRVAEEGPGFRIPVSGRDELAQTLVAFNDMSSRLAQAHAEQQRVLAELRRQVAERERAEEELRLAAQAFEAKEAIFITDGKARILRVNRAFSEITGYAPEEALGQTPRLLQSGCQDQGFYQQMWTQLRTEGRWEGDILNRRKNGEIYPQWLSISAVRNAGGRTSHYVAHFTDITERKHTEKALEEARQRAELASEAKSRFLATMSHEIRTPLNAIINMNDLLLETDLSSEQFDYARTASEAGRNLLSIVNSILDFSKIEAGRIESHPEACDPEEIAASVARLLASRAFTKGIELTLFVDPRSPRRFKTDPRLLRQILLNLLANAIKFTDAGGVRMRVLYEGDVQDGPWVRFDVLDSGIGIPEDRQAELFKEFVQVDGSPTRRHGGTGLGLAISRALARLLGGGLGCESRLGEGSRFWLRLPARDPSGAGRLPQELLECLAQHQILIQSANPILAEELRDQLCAAGLRARLSLKVPGARRWLADERCAGVIALAQAGEAAAGVGGPPLDQALLIRLLRSGRPGELEEGGRKVFDERVPLAPTRLFALLTDLAGVPAVASPAAATLQAPLPVPPSPADKLPILLVEDSLANRQVALAILGKAGYQADTAENGLQAVAAVKNKRYGLVLMDVAMPEMDGLEATRAIRGLPGEQGRMPIVAMTAGAFGEDRQLCLEAGMDDYLSKPIVRPDLLAAVGRWLLDAPSPPPVSQAPQPASALLDEAALRDLEADVSAGLMPSMVQTFILEARRRLANLEHAIDRGDREATGHEAHALKGSAAVFGAAALREESSALEQAAKTEGWERIQDLLPSLRSVARETLDVMERRFRVAGDATDESPSGVSASALRVGS